MEAAGAPVVGIGRALDPAGFFHPVDDAGERDRLDLQPVGVEGLVVVGEFQQREQQPGLHCGEAEAAHALVEGAPQQARAVVEQIADVGFHACAYNKPAYDRKPRWCAYEWDVSTDRETLAADLYFSFRSPYSALAIGRYRALTEEYAVDIALRPVYPLAIRQPDFFERNHPNWLRYTLLDVARVAQFEGIPFGPPRPDPIVQDMATRRIAANQPYIHKITRMGQAAARTGGGLVFAHEVSKLIWGGPKAA